MKILKVFAHCKRNLPYPHGYADELYSYKRCNWSTLSGYKSIQPKFLIVFLVTTAVILVINLKAKGWWTIGVVCGWIMAYALAFLPEIVSIAVPQPFVGTPALMQVLSLHA